MGGRSDLFLSVVGLALIFMINVNCNEYGTSKCNDGSWSPDAKLIMFGLSCPLPLDGKENSKGKTIHCGMKKAGLIDEGKVQVGNITEKICGLFPQDKYNKLCKEKTAECLKDTNKDSFKDPKKDKEYKTWFPFYACMEKWGLDACKKET